MKKDEALRKLEEMYKGRTPSKNEVAHLIKNLTVTNRKNPLTVMTGDVYYYFPLGHPVLVTSIKEGVTYGYMLSSQEKNGIAKVNQRFDKESYVTACFLSIDVQDRNFMYNVTKTEVTRLRKILKEYLIKRI